MSLLCRDGFTDLAMETSAKLRMECREMTWICPLTRILKFQPAATPKRQYLRYAYRRRQSGKNIIFPFTSVKAKDFMILPRRMSWTGLHRMLSATNGIES